MKVLSFIEWVKLQNGDYYWYDRENQIINKVHEIANFYNQQFSVDMLVNPYPKEIDLITGDTDYQQAESLRLFDGWEENENDVLSYLCVINNNHTVVADFMETVISFRENDNYECNVYYFYCGYNNITLNDFITLCNLAGIELKWNENNPQIKEMFR